MFERFWMNCLEAYFWSLICVNSFLKLKKTRHENWILWIEFSDEFKDTYLPQRISADLSGTKNCLGVNFLFFGMYRLMPLSTMDKISLPIQCPGVWMHRCICLQCVTLQHTHIHKSTYAYIMWLYCQVMKDIKAEEEWIKKETEALSSLSIQTGESLSTMCVCYVCMNVTWS